MSACYHYSQTFITHKAEEKFNINCLVSKFKKYSANIFQRYISISDKESFCSLKSPKTKITAKIYLDKIIPQLYYTKHRIESTFLPEGTKMMIIKDNAPIYKAKLIKDEHK